MAGRKSDFTLPTLDDLFSTQELRDDAKLSKIRDIPLELIDDFPDHPFSAPWIGTPANTAAHF